LIDVINSKARAQKEPDNDESCDDVGGNNKLAENLDLGRGKREKRPTWKLT